MTSLGPLCGLVLASFFQVALSQDNQPATSQRSSNAVTKVKPGLERQLAAKGLSWGAPVFIGVFKESRVLEVWLKADSDFKRFAKYEICYFSGKLGPKRREGDLQVPEGFYGVGPKAMNPWSTYHLSFNVGYPNRFDRNHGYTGSLIMIHGNCVSIGCIAMTDPIIEKIYALVEAALLAGQKEVPVHIFPFPLTQAKLETHGEHPEQKFWLALKPGYDYFQKHRKIPKVTIRNRRYQIQAQH